MVRLPVEAPLCSRYQVSPPAPTHREYVQPPAGIRLIDRFTMSGRLRYRWWQVFGRSTPFWVPLRSGPIIQLRPRSSDWSVALEVFGQEVYRLPPTITGQPIRHIVDVGGNVGYTTLYWASQYSEARILAFEPHPANVAAFRQHVQRNRLGDRVVLIPSAAGTREGAVCLWDDGSGSSHVISRRAAEQETIQASMVDWFSQLGTEPIDVLKIDIEGGEYELLADPRFDNLQVRGVVMEWHTTPDNPYGGQWCVERLNHLGYQVQSAGDSEHGDIGMIWATRP